MNWTRINADERGFNFFAQIRNCPRPNYFKMVLNLFLVALAAYLLGSIPSGVSVSRFFARRDVRVVGSGYTGTVNPFSHGGIGSRRVCISSGFCW